jgi:hypothetical protein
VPSEAERAAAKIEVGMTEDQAAAVAGPVIYFTRSATFADGSTLSLDIDPWDFRVTAIRTTPATPVPPLTRLRRTLARIVPALDANDGPPAPADLGVERSSRTRNKSLRPFDDE